MLIRNAENRHHTIAPPHAKGRGAAAGSKRLPTIVLDKGINEVDGEAWAEAEKLPAVQAMIDAGVLSVVVSPKGKPVDDITDLPPTQQVKLVQETESQELLEEWRGDTSGKVRVAIDDQVEKLRKPKNKR